MKRKQGSQFVVIMLERCTKLSTEIFTTKTNGTTIDRIILEHSVANYGIPTQLFTKNGSQLVSKLFVAV